MNSRPLEIFSGTGGVGKTTLATSRAFYLASTKRVLLITIDPARRLKQILNLHPHKIGTIENVKLQNFDDNKSGSFDVLLMNPLSTFNSLRQVEKEREINFILKQLLGTYGGLSEIMSIIELNHHLESKKYDTIILDTPPGKNFVDFLKASQKIQAFFKPQFVKLITQLKDQSTTKSPIFLKQLLQTGIDTLLKYLQKITGEEFIENFITALSDIYELTPKFHQAMQFQQKLANSQEVNWYLVTSADQGKIDEAIKLYNSSVEFLPQGHSVLINKAIEIEIPNQCDKQTQQFLKSLKERQDQLLTSLNGNFSSIHTFLEVIESEPRNHVLSLAEQWKEKENCKDG